MVKNNGDQDHPYEHLLLSTKHPDYLPQSIKCDLSQGVPCMSYILLSSTVPTNSVRTKIRFSSMNVNNNHFGGLRSVLPLTGENIQY